MSRLHAFRLVCPECDVALLEGRALTELLKWDLLRLLLQRGAVMAEEHARAAGHDVKRLRDTWSEEREATSRTMGEGIARATDIPAERGS